MTDEFVGWLRKGLGRPGVYLKTNDSKLFRAPLLEVCTQYLAYDPTCEESRVPYLWKLIELTSDATYYRDAFLAELKNKNHDFENSLVFELAAKFAAAGDLAIKRAMNEAFERHGFSRIGAFGAEELVRLDGAAGLVLVCRSFHEVDADDRPWRFKGLIETLEQRDGKTSVPAEVEHYYQEWQEYEQICERERNKGSRPRLEYSAIKEALDREGMPWARTASDQEMEMAADDLLAEADKKRLVQYLRLFRLRPFPRPIDRLLELAEDQDKYVARGALTILEKVKDPRVRALGLQLADDIERREYAVGLLVQNSEPGDYRIIERLLSETVDPDVYHGLEFDVRHFVDANRSEEAEQSLLLLYENGPCSLCRNAVIDELIAMKRFPNWMREECQYDAYSETRLLVGG